MNPIEGSITEIPPKPHSKIPPIYINKIDVDEEAIIPVVKNLKEVE
jgi:hypothetical protein